jgi:hypothetical protein
MKHFKLITFKMLGTILIMDYESMNNEEAILVCKHCHYHSVMNIHGKEVLVVYGDTSGRLMIDIDNDEMKTKISDLFLRYELDSADIWEDAN